MTDTVAERLARDIYPAEVVLPDGTLLKEARAFVTSSRIIVWTESDARWQPNLVFESALTIPVPRDRGSLRGCVGGRWATGLLMANVATASLAAFE